MKQQCLFLRSRILKDVQCNTCGQMMSKFGLVDEEGISIIIDIIQHYKIYGSYGGSQFLFFQYPVHDLGPRLEAEWPVRRPWLESWVKITVTLFRVIAMELEKWSDCRPFLRYCWEGFLIRHKYELSLGRHMTNVNWDKNEVNSVNFLQMLL